MRQQYIDILKGIAITWVLWMHMGLPRLIYPSILMPIFFFISGTYFHAKAPNLWDHVKNDAFKLLLPTMVFSGVAFFVGCINGTMTGSFYEIVIKCLSNSIVWFLIALFYFRVIAYECVRKDKSLGVLVIATLIYVPGFYLYSKELYWVLPFFPLSHMGTFMIWFAIGLMWGKCILEHVTTPSFKTTGGCIIATLLYVVFVHHIDWHSGIFDYIPFLAYGFPYTLGFIFVFLCIARKIESVSILSPITKILTYIGKNSIVFYLTHWPLWAYIFKNLNWNLYISFTCIVLIEFPLIYIFNHYLPWCIGKKHIKNG